MTHEITLRIRITSRRLAAAFLLWLVAGLPRECSTADYQDISTVTTFYPQGSATFGDPGGGNPSLIVTSQAAIARDFGRVTIGDTNSNTTRVMVGGEWPTEANALRVSGGIRVDGCIWLKNLREGCSPLTRCPTNAVLSTDRTWWRCRWNP